MPDVAVYVGRRPRENERKQALTIADLSIEIISPGQSRQDLKTKCEWYCRQGGDGKYAMLIEPDSRSVEMFQQSSIVDEILTRIYATPAEHASDEPIEWLNELLPDLNLTAATIFSEIE